MPPVSTLIRRPPGGFPRGRTALTRAGDTVDGMPFALGIDFELVHLGPGEICRETDPRESVWLLLDGAADLDYAGTAAEITRSSLFDDAPSALRLGPATRVSVCARQPSEFAVVRTENAQRFTPRLFRPEEIKPEYRGTGLVQNACLRNVRLIFDQASRPESNLVIGEVVNYPGRWSSYPPHHHDQPEVYHYRFTAADGYGHAELGDDVVKVRTGDTTIIPPGRDHAQVAAPGYGMFYLWMIRHLPGNPYTGFTFTEAHRWTLDPAQQGWRPRQPPPGLT